MNKRLVILGGGESGVGAAILGQQKGYDVFLSDRGMLKPKYQSKLQQFNIDFESGQHTTSKIINADLVVKSPGIPDTAALIVALHAKEIEVISEIEFASWFTDATILAVTGTDGKSTTVTMLYDILKAANLNVALAGNIGISFAEAVATKSYDYYVLEVSSFQLDGVRKFKPHVAIITNITEDHLDRYDYNINNYIQSKYRIAQNMDANDYLIYCSDDPTLKNTIHQQGIKATLLPYSMESVPTSVGGYVNDYNYSIFIQKQETMAVKVIGSKSKQGNYNSLAAALGARAIDVRQDFVRKSLEDYRGLEHRMEHVAKLNGVEFINDSKSTNVNSAWYALQSVTKPVVWVMGGVDKGNDYSKLVSLVRDKVKMIITLGEDTMRIHEAFSKSCDVFFTAYSMEEAVKMAKVEAQQGDAVLLSPACSSFNMFENYEDRGTQFKAAVRSF